jgi:hypothetical protein
MARDDSQMNNCIGRNKQMQNFQLSRQLPIFGKSFQDLTKRHEQTKIEVVTQNNLKQIRRITTSRS